MPLKHDKCVKLKLSLLSFIQDHLLTCGQVLEKCPYNCVSYIQRKNMDQHVKVCPRRSSMILNGIKSDVDLATLGERLTMIDDNLSSLRKALNDEIQMRHDIIGELGSLKRRNQVKFWHVKKDFKFLMAHFYDPNDCRYLTIGRSRLAKYWK